ncbi:MAG: type II toxin-antitoxin system prevent-host-death family antitoxin [Gemmatimonadaceae bacterium]
MKKGTYSSVRENLAAVWDTIERTQEPVVISRRGHEDMALMPAAELEGLRETAQLLRSPANARRLLDALARAHGNETMAMAPEEVAARLGLGE